MLGTVINVAAVLAGGSIGLLIKKGLPKRLEESILAALGLGTGLIALNGVLASMFTAAPDGSLQDSGGLLLLVSLVAGTAVGELLRIDDRLNGLGDLAERKLHISGFSKGFISASLVFCVGAMTIVGSLNDGLKGDSSILILKSTLDFVSSLILASSLGPGVLFAAVPVLVIQGGISLGAGALSPFLSDALLDEICMVGYAVVLCIGTNFLGATKIKTANMLPSLLVPILVNMLMLLKTL